MDRLFYWIRGLFFLRNCTLRNFTVFVLILFCIQYIPIESRAGVSMLKIGVSFLCLFFLLMRPPFVSKALIMLAIYFIVVFVCVSFYPQTFRWSTMLYLLSYIIVYLYVYDSVVCREMIDYETFMKFIIGLMYAYVIVLIMQQMLIIVGVRSFPLLNLTQFLDRGIGANSLSYEPSSAARIMAVLYLALIRMEELKQNKRITIQHLWENYRWPTLSFLWTMVTMGSGTAMIALLLTSLYFINIKQIIVAMGVVLVLSLAVKYIEFKPLQRVSATISAVMTGDEDEVSKVDGSAASRIVPMINFFKLDFFDLDTWLGRGIDYSSSQGRNFTERYQVAVLGNINEYGLISYVVLLVFIFTCVIYRVFSLETLFFLALFAGTLGNIAYAWGAMMVFTMVRHYQQSDPK